jgi:VWFA-related protein
LLSYLPTDGPALKRFIESSTALGGTALFEAVHTTLRRLAKIDARKAIVVLSDGDDTQSQTVYKKVLEESKTGDVTIYTIGLGGGFSDPGARSKLKELAEETGGRYFSASKASDLQSVYSRIADELRNQYYLTYASENETFDGRWIPIQVVAKTKGLDVRARRGYYALPRAEN